MNEQEKASGHQPKKDVTRRAALKLAIAVATLGGAMGISSCATLGGGEMGGKEEGKGEGKREGKFEGKIEGKFEGKMEGKFEGKIESKGDR